MSETPQLTVPTAFNDISQLAEGMSDRVDEERLMLYGPGPVDDNSWIRFSVLLMDQSVALAGVGRAVASIDGGEERPEVARFDIVLDNLQFEGTSEVVYERMLVYSSQAFSEGPATGEVNAEEIEAAEAALADEVPPEEVAAESYGEEEDELHEDPTMIASADEYAEHVQATADEVEVEAEAEAEADVGLEDFSEAPAGSEAETVVAEAPSEEELMMPAEGYEEAPPTDIVMDGYGDAEQVADVSADDVGDYEPAATEAEGFSDVSTDDLEGPAEDWGTSEVDVGEVDEVDVADVPMSAPPPAPPSQPPGFMLEAASGALTRPSRGATWTPNLALAADARAASGLFPYAGGLPIPELPPRPDLDPSYHIQPAPRPVEEGGDSTDLEAGGYEEPAEAAGYEEEGYEEAEASPADEEAVAYEEAAPAELEPVETSGLDYDEDIAVPAEPEDFDDLATEVVADEAYEEPPIEGYDDADATRMEIEAPEEQ